MKIYVLAGTKTKDIVKIMDRFNYSIKGSDDIQEGFEQLTLIDDVDTLVLFDDALIRDGHALDYIEVFKSLDNLQPVNANMEILFITKVESLYESFTECLISNSHARCNLVKKLNGSIVDACIKNTYQEEPEQVQAPEEEVTISSVVEEPPAETVEPEPIQEPVPVVRERPREAKPPKPPKEKKVKKNDRQNLGDLLTNNIVLVVTGQHGDGVSSTAVALANTLAKDKVNTLLLDCNIYTKGINRYYDILDDGATVTQKGGLKSAVEDIDIIDQCYVEVEPNLFFMGTSTQTSHKYLTKIFNEEAEDLADLTSILANDFRVTVINIPIDDLLKCESLIKSCDRIIYCAPCTVNGIHTVDRYLCTKHVVGKKKENILKILQRKLNYILTNNTPNTMKPELWLRYLLDFSDENSLHQYILGVVPHYEKFDDFDAVKVLPNKFNKEYEELYYEILKRCFMS